MAIEANSYNIGCDDSEKMLHVCKSITMVSQQRIFFDFLQFCIGSVAREFNKQVQNYEMFL